MIPNISVVLVSKSPRRVALFQSVFSDLRMDTLDFDETYPSDIPVSQIAAYIAKSKLSQYLQHKTTNKNTLVVTSDTTVVFDNMLFEKPKDRDEAIEFLNFLSGKTHEVLTGVAFSYEEKEYDFQCKTLVTLSNLSKNYIHSYIDHYNPLDKAGSYGIQDFFGITKVESIQGCYFNVMGFPMSHFVNKINELGIISLD
ncbi:MAG: Maf family nucleotide pyrophosphatase [Chitinophagales bacterium]|jgi:septum formation protein|nr:Maf family nucleotide pyrophosphatase [Chitinophagales bacterium]